MEPAQCLQRKQDKGTIDSQRTKRFILYSILYTSFPNKCIDDVHVIRSSEAR